jgi:flagellar biosynthesis protein FlhG
MSRADPIQVLAVTGGKGGVGKTNVSINLSIALAAMGRRVMLLDADLGLANIDVLLGLHPQYDLSHVIRGERTLDEILVEGPEGIQVVPASSGIRQMASLSPAEHAGLIGAFSDVADDLEVLVIDTAAGISDSVINFSRAANEVLLVVCDEPASMTDAYAIVKLLNREYNITRFRVLANMVQSPQEGRDLYNKLVRVTDRYLDVMLNFLGAIPFDDSLKKAVKSQRSVMTAFPRSRIAQAFRSIAKKVDDFPAPSGASGHLQFFVERLLQYSSQNQEGLR